MLYGMANNNVVIPAQRDGALYNFLLGNQDYVFEGIGDEFEITPSASSYLITLGEGEGVVCGRHVTEATVNNANSMIQLEANSSGYVVIRVDLTRPVGTEAYLYATPTLQADDLNNGGTVRDLPLYSYVTNGSGVSTFTDIRPLSSGSNVVCVLENGNIYVEQWNNGVKTRKQVGSLDPENLTATPSDVKSGMIFGGYGSDDPQTGTFAAQTKTVSPSRSQQIIVPDGGSYLSSVTVNGARPASGTRKVYADWYYSNQHTYTVTGITVGSLIVVRNRFASGSGFTVQSGMSVAYTSANTAGNTETVRIGYATSTSITFAISSGEVYLIVDELSYQGG